MKNFTHPPFAHTIIRLKDGSTHSKYWRYARNRLLLEGELKNWDTLSSTQKGKSPVFSKQVDSFTNVQTNSQSTVQQHLPFWLL